MSSPSSIAEMARNGPCNVQIQKGGRGGQSKRTAFTQRGKQKQTRHANIQFHTILVKTPLSRAWGIQRRYSPHKYRTTEYHNTALTGTRVRWVLAIGQECHVISCLQTRRLHRSVVCYSLPLAFAGLALPVVCCISISWEGGPSKMFLRLLGRGPRRFIGCRLWRCWAAVASAGVEVAREAASLGSRCKSDSFSILWILESVSWTKPLPLEVHALDAPGWSDAHRNKLQLLLLTITTFGSVFFSFRCFWMTCCIVFLDKNFTRIGLVLPALFTPTRWAASMCSGVMCFRSSRLWTTCVAFLSLSFLLPIRRNLLLSLGRREAWRCFAGNIVRSCLHDQLQVWRWT